jgi:hypothetical protein
MCKRWVIALVAGLFGIGIGYVTSRWVISHEGSTDVVAAQPHLPAAMKRDEIAPERADSEPADKLINVGSIPVAVKDGASKELDDVASDLQAFLTQGRIHTLWHAPKNPICCLWLDVAPWHAIEHPGEFVIHIESHQAVLMATDMDQLRSAVALIKDVATIHGPGVHLPRGIMTNVPVTEFRNQSLTSER